MTMRTLLTAAAIISSAVGSESPSTVLSPISTSNVATVVMTERDTQLGAEFAALDQQADTTSAGAVGKADPADSLYRLAREAMSRGDYKRAAEIFHRIPERYPQSAYAGQAMYYEAYSLYRSGER